MAQADVVLHQFQASHFNEKARWGLDWKEIPHRRVTYLPGPHALFLRHLSGQTQTPVLVLDGQVIAGSAQILAELERLQPARPLLPTDSAQRQQALALQERFDREVGPAVRTVIFSVLLQELDYLCAVFGRSKPWLVQQLYGAMLPVARPVIAQVNGVSTPGNIERSLAITHAALDEIAERSAATGYLVGDSFSIADLACAALFVPIVGPDHPDTTFPPNMPDSVARSLGQFAEHPGVAWVKRIYARHRPMHSACID